MHYKVKQLFKQYDKIKGIHNRLLLYISDNGKWKLNYYIAYLSHEVYKTRGFRGHKARENIRVNLKKYTDRILNGR